MSEEVEGLEPIEGPVTINIGNLGEGAIIDKFDIELSKCLANIYDMNTPAKAARTITLKIKLLPSDDRVRIGCEVAADSSLAAAHSDAEGALHGIVVDPRQLNIFSPPKPKEQPKPIEFKVAGK